MFGTQSLAKGIYTKEQIKAALHAPNRTISFRYELLSDQNKFKQQLSNVISASIDYDSQAEIKRTARFLIKDDGVIDFLKDRIKPYCRLYVPPGRILARYYSFVQPQFAALFQEIQEAPETGGWVEWPLGVFLLSTPSRKAGATLSILRDVEAYDQLQVLKDDRVTGRYLISAGTNFITAVKNILDSAGIASQNLTSTTKTLPVDREWDGGTSKLEIINELLEAINYEELFFDENGVAIAMPYTSPDKRASEYTYQDNDQSVIFPGVEETLDLFNVPNRWVLIVSEPDRAVLKSIYTNDNPNSLTSTVSRGRTIVDYRQVDAPDQETLDALAERLAYQASQVYQEVKFETGIMPMHSHNDVYTLEYSKLGISAKYEEIGWSFEMKAGAKMSHTIRRVVSV